VHCKAVAERLLAQPHCCGGKGGYAADLCKAYKGVTAGRQPKPISLHQSLVRPVLIWRLTRRMSGKEVANRTIEEEQL